MQTIDGVFQIIKMAALEMMIRDRRTIILKCTKPDKIYREKMLKMCRSGEHKSDL
jgi:hypothetical protein